MQQQGDFIGQPKDYVRSQEAAIVLEATNPEPEVVIQRKSKEMWNTHHFYIGRNPGISL